MMSIAIIWVFVQRRELLATPVELAANLVERGQNAEDRNFATANLFEAIRQLLASLQPDYDRNIGFNRQKRSCQGGFHPIHCLR